MLKEYIKVLDTVNNQEFINLKQKILELDINREKLIDLNLKMIINNDELQSKLLKNDKEKNEINSRINSIKNKDNSNKILVIEKNIELLLNVKDNLNIYTNLFIDRIMVIEGDTRYKMDFEIHLKNKEIVRTFFEN